MSQLQGNDLLQGTLDMLILRTLARGSTHGWGVSRRIRDRSEEVLHLNQGSLYPALHRLERRGLIASEWGMSENNRRAKFYHLTRRGEAHLSRETESWRRFAKAVDLVLAGA
jgi:PadR family transcriptional regulator PadR